MAMAVLLIPSVTLVVAAALWYKKFVHPIVHITTGAKRRALCPPEMGIGGGAQDALAAKDVFFYRALFALKDGAKIFYQIVEPAGRPPSHIIVMFHGFTSYSDVFAERAVHWARQGALVVLLDLPGHGRSDGLLLYLPDWWAFVGSIWEFLEGIVDPLRARLSNQRKVFAVGNSLGGGVSACLAIQRPTFFEGIVMIAPLLSIADETKPPKIVQEIFSKGFGPFKLTWPVTPAPSVACDDFEHAAQGKAWSGSNPFSFKPLKPRLATAVELGMTFPNWMGAHMSQLRAPFLVLHSRADKVTDPKISERLHAEACSSDKTLRLVDDARHLELACCTPGIAKLIGVDFTPAQLERTSQCFGEIDAWVAARV